MKVSFPRIAQIFSYLTNQDTIYLIFSHIYIHIYVYIYVVCVFQNQSEQIKCSILIYQTKVTLKIYSVFYCCSNKIMINLVVYSVKFVVVLKVKVQQVSHGKNQDVTRVSFLSGMSREKSTSLLFPASVDYHHSQEGRANSSHY